MSERLPQRPEFPMEIPFMSDYPEWDNLVAADMATSVEAGKTDPYSELRRTLCTLYALDNTYSHIYEDDPEATADDLSYERLRYDSIQAEYEAFTAGQPEDDKLDPEAYSEVTALMSHALPTPKHYRRMQYFMLVSDACKNPALLQAVGMPADGNHDQALVRMFTPEYAAVRQRYFPSFDDPEKFDDEDQEEMLTMIRAMGFNFPGWIQSQGSVRHLELLPETMAEDTKLRFLIHGILDVMGVVGNRSQTSSLAYTQSTHDRFMHGLMALTGTHEDLGLSPEVKITPAVRNMAYLSRRAAYFGVTGIHPDDAAYVALDHEPRNDTEKAALENIRYYNARQDLIAQIRIANHCAYRMPEQFARLRNAYLKEAGSVQGLDRLSMTLASNVEYEFDYGPSLFRSVLGNSEASIRQGLAWLNHLAFSLAEARHRHSIEQIRANPQIISPEYNHPDYDDPDGMFQFGPTYKKAVVATMRDLALAAREPGFDITTMAVDTTFDGETIKPRLVTPEQLYALGIARSFRDQMYLFRQTRQHRPE